MGSPFKGATDYLAATGRIDSFSGHPLTATITLIIAFLLTLYFIYASYVISHKK
jgi:hypothetical protein